MTSLRTLIYLLSAPTIFAALCSAQSVDVYGGAGTAVAASSGTVVDTFGNGTLYTTPRMGGLFLKFGGTFMFTPHLGTGMETSFRANQGSYAGLTYRPTFYDFNGVYHPIAGKRVIPEFQGGLGAVNLKYYYSQQYCDAFVGCSTTNSVLESTNHFQVHFSGGVKFYLTGSFFLKPQVDVHWVHNFSQFGSDWVPEYGGAIGYTFGQR